MCSESNNLGWIQSSYEGERLTFGKKINRKLLALWDV